MKVITSTTVRLKGKEGHDHYAPGEHDFDDAIAKDLLKRGHAVTPAAKAKADAEAKDPGPTVQKVPGKKDDPKK